MKKLLSILTLLTITTALFAHSANLVVKKDFSKGEVNKLSFKLSSENVHIESIYGDGITMEIYCNNNKKIPLVVLDDDSLNFTTKAKNTTKFDQCDIFLYIPQDFKLKDFEFKATSGDLDFEKLDSESFTCSITSGDVDGKNLYVDDDVKIQLTSGDIEIKTVTCGNLKAYATSGEIELENVTASTVSAECTSGDIEIKSLNGESLVMKTTSGTLNASNAVIDYFDAKTTSGSIILDLKKAPKASSKIHSTSGEVELNVPANEGFDLECSSTSGSFHDKINDLRISARNTFSNSYYGGGSKISISTTSGSIELKANK